MKKAFLPLAFVPLALSAATVYEADFGSGALNPGTYTVGSDWTVASTKGITSSIDASGLTYGIANTTSAFVEVQSRALSSAYSLGSVGDSLTLTFTFNNVSNVNVIGLNSLAFGLFNTAGQDPSSTVGSHLGDNPGDINFATGNAADWKGYVAQFNASGYQGIYTRDAQLEAGQDRYAENQELLYNNTGSGAYDNPGATTLLSNNSGSVLLTEGNVYTGVLTVTATASGLDLTAAVYDGAGTSGTMLGSISASDATPLTTSFDGISIGFQDKDTTLTNPNTMKLLSATLTSASAVPEPSSYAGLFGLAGLGVAALYRRRRA